MFAAAEFPSALEGVLSSGWLGSAAGGRRYGARNLCGGPVERGLRDGAGRSEGNLGIFKPSQVVPVAAFACKTKSEDKTKVGC